MESVGQKLRLRREAMGSTLEQVNSSTRIPIRSLEAIEADELSVISSAFLYKSFVKQFAQHLGMEYDELQAGVEASTNRIPAPLIPGEGHNAAPRVAALPIGRRKNARWVQSVASFTAAVVACSGVYTLWQSRANLSSPLAKVAAWAHFSGTGSEERTPNAADSSRSAQQPAAVHDGRTLTASGNAKPDEDGFTLQLSATEPAWLSIVADGRQSFKGILEKAETRTLEGHDNARIRTGNAGGVQVVFNGKALGPLGPRGQVRTVVFTKSNYEVVEGPEQVGLAEFNQTAALMQSSLLLKVFPRF